MSSQASLTHGSGSFTNVYDVRRTTLQESGTDGDTAVLPRKPAGGSTSRRRVGVVPSGSTGQFMRNRRSTGTPVQMAAGKIDGTGKPRLIYATRRINAQSMLCVTDSRHDFTKKPTKLELYPRSSGGDSAGKRQ